MGRSVGGGMKIHVGSGDKHWPGFVNVDAHGDPDVVSDGRKLPFDPDAADEIHAIHFVEHIPRLDVDNMLADWYRVLKPGGKVVIEVPCLDKIAQMIVEGEKNIRMTTMGLFGDPRDPKPGMMHAWAYSKKELAGMLEQAGFKEVTEGTPAFHVPRRDMRIEAVK